MQAERREPFLNNQRKRILIVIFAFLMMYLVGYIINPFSPYWRDYFKRDYLEILIDWGTSFVFCLLISEANIFISNRLNKRIPWTEHPGKRLFLEIALNLSVIPLICLINSFFVYFAIEGQVCVANAADSFEETKDWIYWLATSFIITFVIIGINTGNYLISNWKDAALKATELSRAAVEAELQSLKLQIDPHFVFNNLSVLSELILENQQLGYEYAENFSKIYRYLLVNSKKNTILVQDELKFLCSYIFLIKHRFGEVVTFEINVDEADKQLHMPPFTLQLLVENALKHNKTNEKEPLKISICTNDKAELIIENTLLPIEKPMDSSGIGIENIIRRYRLLSEKEPQIVRSETSFKVIIPLIKL